MEKSKIKNPLNLTFSLSADRQAQRGEGKRK